MMSRISLAMILLCQFTYPLAFDYASFRYAKNLNLVEIYYSIPYRDLIFQTVRDTIFTDVRIDYSIHSFFDPDSVTDSAFHRFVLTSFKEAEERDLTMIDQRNFYARPGRYWLNFTISCLTDTPAKTAAQRVGFYSDTLIINDYSDSLNLSDIELAAQITLDTNLTAADKFYKSGLLVIPNPSRQFGLAYDRINVYLEAYNMVPDTQSFEITYAILDSNRIPVKTFPAEKRKKEGSSVSLTFAMSAKELSPGSYYLFVRLRDLTTAKEVSRFKQFFILEPLARLRRSQPHPLYEMIHLLATEKEVRYFKKLSPAARKKFLEQFWAKHNFSEFKDRVQYADLHFSLGQKLGHETDRGRIYIKYGPPDEIEDLPMTDYSNPQQKWRYYKKQLIFIFIDIYNNGNLQLIYSNSTEEKNHPDWKKYVNPEEVRE